MAETVFSPRILPQVTPVNPNIIQGSVTQIKPLSVKELNDAKNDEEDRKLRRELMRDRENMQNERLDASRKAAEARAKDTWRNNQVRAMNDFSKNRFFYGDTDEVYIGYLPEAQREALLSVNAEGQQIVLDTIMAPIDSWNATETRNKFTDFSAKVDANEDFRKAKASLGHLKSYMKALDKLGVKANQEVMAQQLDAFRDTGDVRVLIANDTDLDGAQEDFTKLFDAALKSIGTDDRSQVGYWHQELFEGIRGIMTESSETEENKADIVNNIYNRVINSVQAQTYLKRRGQVEDDEWVVKEQYKMKTVIESAVEVALRARVKHVGTNKTLERTILENQAKTDAAVANKVETNMWDGLSSGVRGIVEELGGTGYPISEHNRNNKVDLTIIATVTNTEADLKEMGYTDEDLGPMYHAVFRKLTNDDPIRLDERDEEGSIRIINDDTDAAFKGAVIPMMRYNKNLVPKIQEVFGKDYTHEKFAKIFAGLYRRLDRKLDKLAVMEDITVTTTDDNLLFKHEGKTIATYDRKTNKFISR